MRSHCWIDSGQPIPQAMGDLGCGMMRPGTKRQPTWFLDNFERRCGNQSPGPGDSAPSLHPRPARNRTSGKSRRIFSGSMSLPGGSMLNGLGENADGKAFISIAGDSANMQTQCCLVTATTKEGDELRSAGGSPGGRRAGPALSR